LLELDDYIQCQNDCFASTSTRCIEACSGKAKGCQAACEEQLKPSCVATCGGPQSGECNVDSRCTCDCWLKDENSDEESSEESGECSAESSESSGSSSASAEESCEESGEGEESGDCEESTSSCCCKKRACCLQEAREAARNNEYPPIHRLTYIPKLDTANVLHPDLAVQVLTEKQRREKEKEEKEKAKSFLETQARARSATHLEPCANLLRFAECSSDECRRALLACQQQFVSPELKTQETTGTTPEIVDRDGCAEHVRQSTCCTATVKHCCADCGTRIVLVKAKPADDGICFPHVKAATCCEHSEQICCTGRCSQPTPTGSQV
jgi:hypothetical protein